MPRIPQRQQGSFLSTNVSRGPQPQVDTTASDILDVAAGALQTGQKLIEAREKSKAEDYSFNSMLDFQRDFALFKADTEREMAPTGENYTRKIDDFLKERRSKLLTDAPNDLAKQSVSKMYDQYSTQSLIQAEAKEYKVAANHYVQSIDDQVNKSRSQMVELPDPTLAEQQINLIQGKIETGKGVHFDDQKGTKAFEERSASIAESVFDGYINNENFGTGLALLKDDKSVSRYLTPDQKNSLLKKLNRGKSSQDGMKMREINARIHDHEIALTSGKMIPDQIIDQDLLAIRSNPQMDEPTYKRLESRLVLAKEVGKGLNELKDIPFDQWDSLSIGIPKGQEGFEYNKQKAQNAFSSSKENLKRQAYSDMPSYLMQTNPGVREAYKMAATGIEIDPITQQIQPDSVDLMNQAFSKSIAVQKQLKVPAEFRRIADNNLIKSMSEQFNTNDPTLIRAQLDGVLQTSGDFGYQMLDEVSRFGAKNTAERKKFSAIALSAYMSDPDVKGTVINNAVNAGVIEDRYKKIKGDAVSSAADINNAMASNQTWSQFASRFSPEQSGLVNKMADAVSLEAKKNIIDGISESKAVKNAIESIVDANFMMVDEGSPLAVPRTFKNQPVSEKRVNAFFEVMSTKEGFESLDVEEKSDYSLDQLADEHRWFQDKSGTGFTLARAVPTAGGIKYQSVKNKSGEEIVIGLGDIVNTDNDLVLAQEKDFFTGETFTKIIREMQYRNVKGEKLRETSPGGQRGVRAKRGL